MSLDISADFDVVDNPIIVSYYRLKADESGFEAPQLNISAIEFGEKFEDRTIGENKLSIILKNFRLKASQVSGEISDGDKIRDNNSQDWIVTAVGKIIMDTEFHVETYRRQR